MTDIGHNTGTDPAFAFQERVADLVATANLWLDRVPEIRDAETAARAKDFEDQCRQEWEAIDAGRVELRAPLNERLRKIQEAFAPLLTKLETIIGAFKDRRKSFLITERRRFEQEARKREEEALAAMQAAEDAKKKPAETIEDMLAQEEAEKAAVTALRAATDAAKAKPIVRGEISGSRGAGLRTYWHAKLVNYETALAHYGQSPEVRAAVLKLAENDAKKAKTAGSFHGCEYYSEERA